MTTEEENRLLQLIYDVRAYIADGFIMFGHLEKNPYQIAEITQLRVYQQHEWWRLLKELEAIQGLYWDRMKKPTLADCLLKIQQANI